MLETVESQHIFERRIVDFWQVARLKVPYMMMHMRGDLTTMHSPEHHEYWGNVCLGVGTELALNAQRALDAGIKPWRLILDPGENAGLVFQSGSSGFAPFAPLLEAFNQISAFAIFPDWTSIPACQTRRT